jgi:hypothetical protein
MVGTKKISKHVWCQNSNMDQIVKLLNVQEHWHTTFKDLSYGQILELDSLELKFHLCYPFSV